MSLIDTLNHNISNAFVIKNEKIPKNFYHMTVSFNIDINFNVDQLAHDIKLKSNGIVDIRFGDITNLTTNRSILDIQNKKHKSNLRGVLAMKVMINSLKKPVNIKIFRNGLININGCKTAENIIDLLTKVFTEFQTVQAMTIINMPLVDITVFDKSLIDNASQFLSNYVHNIHVQIIKSE